MSPKNEEKFYKKKAFSLFVESLKQNSFTFWKCCNEKFYSKSSVHLHVSKKHASEIKNKAIELTEEDKLKNQEILRKNKLNKENQKKDLNEFVNDYKCSCKLEAFTVILFYHYVKITDDELKQLKTWQVVSYFHYSAVYKPLT